MASPKLERTATPGIYKRGGRYVVVFRDPTGRQRKQFARTLAEARKLKATLTADVTRGAYRALSKVTFAEYASQWLDTYAGRTSKGIQDHTRADYRKRLEQDAVPFFGRMRLSAIEPRHVKEFVAHVASRGVKRNTVRLSLAPVRALFATAVEEGLIRSNPAAGLRLFITPASPTDDERADDAGRDVDSEGDVKALSEDELALVLEQLPADWRSFFEFLSQTGLRIGEAVELRWRDVDLGQRWLHVRRRYYRGKVGLPKGRKKRRVRLSAAMATTLWALRKETRPGDDDLVFTSEKGLRIDASNLMSRVLKPAAVDAGLGERGKSAHGRSVAVSWVGFHTFRHTCATMLFRRGWNAVQVQRFLGHSDPGFTLRTYVHLLPEDLPEPDFATAPGATNRQPDTPKPAETAPTASAVESISEQAKLSVALGAAGR